MARLGGAGDERAAVEVRKDHPAVQGTGVAGVLQVLHRYGLSASPAQLEDIGRAYRYTIVDPALMLRDSWWSESDEDGRVLTRWARPRALGPPDRSALLAQVREFRAKLADMSLKNNPSGFARHVIQSILVSKDHPQVVREGIAGARKVAAHHHDLSGGEAENTPGFYIFTQIDSTLMDPRSFVTRREGPHVQVRSARLASDSATIDMERTASRCDMAGEGKRKPRLPCTVVYEDPELSAVVRMTDAQYSRAAQHASARDLLRRYGKARIRFLSLPLTPVLKRMMRGSGAAVRGNPSKVPHSPAYPKIGSEVIFVPRQGGHPSLPEGVHGRVIRPPPFLGASPYINVAWDTGEVHPVLASDLERLYGNPACGTCPAPGDTVSLQPSAESAACAMDQCIQEGREMPRLGSICTVTEIFEHTEEVSIVWEDGLEEIWAADDVVPV